MKLSQYLKIGGIVLAALGAIKIVFAELEVFQIHWISVIIIGLGAAVWFAGAWEARHEAIVAGVKATTTSTTSTVIGAPPTTTA